MVAIYELSPPLEGTFLGEARMLPDLVRWLRLTRRIRGDSLLVQEMPLNGRRVDLAVMTRSGALSAFELKLGGFGRVLEQAAYNRLSFDRSWIVIESQPRSENIAAAREFGIGVIVVRGSKPAILVRPGHAGPDPALRARVTSRLRKIEAEIV